MVPFFFVVKIDDKPNQFSHRFLKIKIGRVHQTEEPLIYGGSMSVFRDHLPMALAQWPIRPSRFHFSMAKGHNMDQNLDQATDDPSGVYRPILLLHARALIKF